jgi:hypothetical protein
MRWLDPGTVLYAGSTVGQVRSGETWTVSDGPRLVWSADSRRVIYSQRGKFYEQSSRGFEAEVRTSHAVEGGRRAEFMARIAEVEMKFLMGVVAGSSGLGFAAVVGPELAMWYYRNRDNFEKWQRQLDSVLRVRAFLKKHTPTLYDRVFNALLRQYLSKIPDAITAETVAFAAGVILGEVGEKLAAGKFSILWLVWAVVWQIGKRFVLDVSYPAYKLTEDEYRKLAQEIISKLREGGVTIDQATVKKIVEEVKHHPKEIKEAFDMLRGVFGKGE